MAKSVPSLAVVRESTILMGTVADMPPSDVSITGISTDPSASPTETLELLNAIKASESLNSGILLMSHDVNDNAAAANSPYVNLNIFIIVLTNNS